MIQVSEQNRVVDPVLAFARDQIVYFYQVSKAEVSLVKLLSGGC